MEIPEFLERSGIIGLYTGDAFVVVYLSWKTRGDVLKV